MAEKFLALGIRARTFYFSTYGLCLDLRYLYLQACYKDGLHNTSIFHLGKSVCILRIMLNLVRNVILVSMSGEIQ